MHRSHALRFATGILGTVAAVAAFAAEPAAPPATPTATPPSQALICRDRLRPGSHIAIRTCLTAAQWAAPNWQAYRFGAYSASGGVHDGAGAWGQVSTAGQSVGMSAFTAR